MLTTLSHREIEVAANMHPGFSTTRRITSAGVLDLKGLAEHGPAVFPSHWPVEECC